jgi:(heptosyl)LPS beta-1,4-glucosyltransferase
MYKIETVSESIGNPRITAVILTLNEAKHIVECLQTLAWADETLVFDSFSNDQTVFLAQQHGARVSQHKFEHYAQQRNAALNAVNADWVFFVDADERCTPALAAEIRLAIRSTAHHVWAVPRHNYLFGRLTQGNGWFPDYQARLFQVGQSGFDPNRMVHELPIFEGALGYLKEPLTHYNYENIPQFHAKQRKYAQLDANTLFQQGIRAKPHNFLLQPLREFRRRFFGLRGYRDGLHGLRLSLLLAYYNFDMYRRLQILQNTP